MRPSQHMRAKMRPVFSLPVTVVADCGRGNWQVANPVKGSRNLMFHESVLKLAGDDAGKEVKPGEHEEATRLWDNGTRRVAQVLNTRRFYRKEQVLVRFMAETNLEWVNRGSLPNDEALIEAFLHARPSAAKRK